MASIVNILTKSDADFRRTFVYKAAGGAPIDLTGSNLRMVVRKNAGDINAMIDVSINQGTIILEDAVNGRFTIAIPKASLMALPPDIYVHALVMVNSSTGAVVKIWDGTLTHSAGPAR